MKRILLFFAGLLSVAAIGFYLYTNSKKQSSKSSLWEYVPADAVVIYENKKPAFAPSREPDFAVWLRRAIKQDSVFISPANTKEVLVSLHITAKEDFGILYYLADSSILASKSVKKLAGSGHTRQRNFEGYTIREIPGANAKSISYITEGKNVIISRESFLIEDVIRSLKEASRGFLVNRDELFHLMPADAGQGKIYANVNGTARFASIFLTEEFKTTLFKNPVSSVITDARIEKNTLSLNGFATDSAAEQTSLLSLFSDQRPVTATIQKTISNRSLLFVHYGIPDYTTWNKRRLEWSRKQEPSLRKSFSDEEKKNSLTPFYQYLGNEAGFCFLDGTKGQKDEVLILKVKEKSQNKLIEALSGELQPSEVYANYPIHAVKSPEFLRTALWPVNENKNLNFYTLQEPWFFFAENAEVLKGVINDIEEDNTWGKSAEWNEFFNSTSLETNLSVEFNGALLTPWMMNKFTPRWDSVSFPRPWGSLDKGAFQFSRLNYNYYFNGVLQFDPVKKKTGKAATNSNLLRVSFPDEITSVSLVKNHTNNSSELLVQTADKSLMLLASDFKNLFTDKLTDKIQSRVVQIDFYKNKKLQYLFLAGHKLYLIDRLGNNVKGFPVDIDTPSDPDKLAVVDYDNSKNYRFLISDQKGNLIMLDREGKLLDGWSKQSTGSRLVGEPRTVRSEGKDYIVTVGVTGTVHVFNRKGESITGFPMSSAIHPEGEWFFDKSVAGQEGVITMVSSEGVKIQIALNGKVVNRENYVKAAANSRFALVVSPSSEDYVISRTDRGKIAVLNRKGDVLFEQENPGSEILECTYLLPAAGEKVIVFRDPQQDFAYLFNEQGTSLFNHPVEATKTPVMVRRQKEGVVVFAVLNTELKKYVP